MVFKHLVKHNGKYYPAGTDVPVGGNTVEDKKTEKPKKATSAISISKARSAALNSTAAQAKITIWNSAAKLLSPVLKKAS